MTERTAEYMPDPAEVLALVRTSDRLVLSRGLAELLCVDLTVSAQTLAAAAIALIGGTNPVDPDVRDALATAALCGVEFADEVGSPFKDSDFEVRDYDAYRVGQELLVALTPQHVEAFARALGVAEEKLSDRERALDEAAWSLGELIDAVYDGLYRSGWID